MKRITVLALALLVLGAAAAVARAPRPPVAGSYKGRSSQKLAVKVAVRTTGRCGAIKAPCVTRVDYRAHYACYDDVGGARDGGFTDSVTLRGAPIRRGRVSATFGSISSGDKTDLRIRFDGRRASGWLHEYYADNDTLRACYTEPPANARVTFSLKR